MRFLQHFLEASIPIKFNMAEPPTPKKSKKEPYHCKSLPRQNPKFNPFRDPIHLKIFIVGFQRFTNYPIAFPTSRLRQEVHKFTEEYHFFNPKTKKPEGHLNNIEIATDKTLAAYGARTVLVIRPRVREETNPHTIQQCFNEKIHHLGLMTIWMTEKDLEFYKYSHDRLGPGMQFVIRVMIFEYNWWAHERNKQNVPRLDHLDLYMKDNAMPSVAFEEIWVT